MLKKYYIIITICIAVLYLGFYKLNHKDSIKSNGLNSVRLSPSFLSISNGFHIDIVAKDLDNPRVILFDSRGRLLVSETKAGRVSILEDKDRNGEFETKRILLQNLKSPHGLDFYKGPKNETTYLYIAETHQVSRYPYDVSTGNLASATPENIAFLPKEGRHLTRTIAFGPNFRKKPIVKGAVEEQTLSDNKLYISVGSSCDVCVEDDWKRAAILESDPEGSFTAELAGGLRNSVFFTFHPETKEIWATEMGRDGLGDNLPPDEINIIKVAGPENKFGARRYGWPFCYGNNIRDKTFNSDEGGRVDISANCDEAEPATIELPAHSAPMGLAFISSSRWPKEWQGSLLVAYHGSTNRSELTGYKIVRIIVDKNGKVSKIEDFISGWLKDGKVSGRPVDLKFGPDGALYISDDFSGLIYKVIPGN